MLAGEDSASSRSSFSALLGWRATIADVTLSQVVAPAFGTVLVVDTWGRWTCFALTCEDELVQVRDDHRDEDGDVVMQSGDLIDRRGDRVGADHHADVGWVLAALDGADPVLRLHVLDLLGAELVPVEQFSFDPTDMAWHAGLVAVRADERVHARVRAARTDPEPWIAEAAEVAARRLGLPER